MNQRDKYRQSESSWKDVAFSPAKNDERGKYDANEQARFQVRLELQYDLKNSDLKFVRFLFVQEIIAREHDSFQGEGALSLAAYLLAGFRHPADVPLFVRAKFANFDTACGFDVEYIFIALREQTEQYLEANCPEMVEQLREYLDNTNILKNIDEWWESLANTYPDAKEKEDLLVLYNRCCYFDDLEKAARYLDLWIEQEPESEDKWNTVIFEYAQLGKYMEAAEVTCKMLEKSCTLWDQSSWSLELIELYRQAGEFDAALNIARQLDSLFASFDDWIGVGLGRSASHEVFELSHAHPDDDAAHEAFALADNWFATSRDAAILDLEAGVRAAKRCGLEEKREEYQALAISERIKNKMTIIPEDPNREDRIHDEALADTYYEKEKAMGWYYYIEDKLHCPFKAKCISIRQISPLQEGEVVDVYGMASEDECMKEVFVEIIWHGREFAVPLSQLDGIDVDEETREAIEDWHYWVARGYKY